MEEMEAGSRVSISPEPAFISAQGRRQRVITELRTGRLAGWKHGKHHRWRGVPSDHKRVLCTATSSKKSGKSL